MTTKSVQWGTAIYDSEGEVPLSGSGNGIGGLHMKRIHIVKSATALDLPDAACWHVNLAQHCDASVEVVMTPELFTELLRCVKDARLAEQPKEDKLEEDAGRKETHKARARHAAMWAKSGRAGVTSDIRGLPSAAQFDDLIDSADARAAATDNDPVHTVEVPIGTFRKMLAIVKFDPGPQVDQSPAGDCDDCDPCDDDLDDDGRVMPAACDVIATATLIQYENRIESTNPVGGLPTLNRMFADGWQFQCQVGPDLILLKRRKG